MMIVGCDFYTRYQTIAMAGGPPAGTRKFNSVHLGAVEGLATRLIDKWGDSVYAFSHHAYEVATEGAPVLNDDDKHYTIDDADSDWQHHTEQYFIPSGHLRETLKREFPG